MQRTGFLLALCLLLLMVLTGCANPLRPDRDEWPRIGSEFARALRWGEFQAASTYTDDDSRAAFISAFPADGSLRVTEARFEPTTPSIEGRAQGKLFLEYFRQKSISVKQTVLPLEWECRGGNAVQPCSWRMVTMLDPLP